MPKIAKEDDIRYLKKIQNKLQKNKFNQNNKKKLKEISDKIRILENKKTDNQPNTSNQSETDNQSETNKYSIELSFDNEIKAVNGSDVYFTFKSGFKNKIFNMLQMQDCVNSIDANKISLFVPWKNMQIAIFESENLAMCFSLGIDNYDSILSIPFNKEILKKCNTYQFTSDNKRYLAIIAKSIQTDLVNNAYGLYYSMTGKMINNFYIRITGSVEKSIISNEIPSEFAERYIKIDEIPDNEFMNKMNIKASIKVSTNKPEELIRTIKNKLGNKVTCAIIEKGNDDHEDNDEDDNNKQNIKIPPGHTAFSWNKRDSKVPCGHTNFSW